MSNFLHTKAQRTQIYKTLPSNDVGNDGDIILSQIQGRGVYLCSKVNGRWHVSTKMEELRKIEKTSVKDLKVDSIKVDNVRIGNPIKIREKSAALPDTAGYGQLWVKTAIPAQLWFTTDAGSDIQLTSGTSIVDNWIKNDTDDTMDAALLINKDMDGDAASNRHGLKVDFDRTVATSGTAAHNDIGIDLDVNSASLGTSSVRGMDIDVVGATSGTQTVIGIDLDADGSNDTVIGMQINTAGTHLKLVANADANDYATFTLADTGDLTIATVGSGTTDSDLTLDADGSIFLESEAYIYINTPIKLTSTIAGQFFLYYDTNNYAKLDVSSTGDLEIETVGSGTTDSDITLNADGDILMDAAGGDVTITSANLSIAATKKLYLDGGGDTYIQETSGDRISIAAGDTVLLDIRYHSTGNVLNLSTTAAGFTQFEPTYNASDTNVNFNDYGNKAFVTFGAGNITDMNLYFPSVSCNCVLLLKQDASGGSREVTNWKTFDQADGNESTVVWAGGSAPTLTTDTNHIDIISFYWDNDNHKAYGVATLNFPD